MRYHQLISKLASQTGYTKREIRTMLRVLADIINEELGGGRDVSIDHIGCFKNLPRGYKNARHPETGERIHVPPSRRVKLEASATLVESVLGSMEIFQKEDYHKRFLPKEDDDGKVRSTNRQRQSRKRKTRRRW